MIRGGGDPNTAVALVPYREWARRLGASPLKRMIASWSGSRMDPTEYKVVARVAPRSGLPSNHPRQADGKENAAPDRP
jgi:hypothetical protein